MPDLSQPKKYQLKTIFFTLIYRTKTFLFPTR